MVMVRHFFDCAVCRCGENPRRYGEGEFRTLWVEIPEDYHGRIPPPQRLNLCHRHYEIMAKLAEWDRWDAFQRLCYEEQEGPEPEYFHLGDESEERERHMESVAEQSPPPAVLKTCSRCPTQFLMGTPARVRRDGHMVEQELCDHCAKIRAEKLELLAIHSYCGIIPEML